MLLVVFCLGIIGPMLSAPAQADEKDWSAVGDQMVAVIDQIPGQYQAQDQEGVERSIRQAYYEIYQVSGLEAQIDHRLEDERADAAFLILIREGVEALLVVAALVTYVLKTGRRDQLKGVYLGIAAAVAVSIGLAITFSSLTSSAGLGMSQELIEGVVGFLAVAMLIYISNWILSKSEGDAWHRYINETIDKQAASGGQWALSAVAFLAVAREGFETILFFVPVFGAAQTPSDHLLIWLGMAAAVVVLAILFVAVRYFGVRLPLRPFFRWMSVVLSVLAIIMAGGAAKELQDAMVLEVTPVAGVPQIEWLGLYPTVETLVVQAVVTLIVVALAFAQFRKSSTPRNPPPPTPTKKLTKKGTHSDHHTSEDPMEGRRRRVRPRPRADRLFQHAGRDEPGRDRVRPRHHRGRPGREARRHQRRRHQRTAGRRLRPAGRR